MATLGTHITMACPICADPIAISIRVTGTDTARLTATLDSEPVRQHVAAAHG